MRDTPPGRTTSYHKYIFISPHVRGRGSRCDSIFGLQPASGPWPFPMTEMWNEIIAFKKRKRDVIQTPANAEPRKRVSKCEHDILTSSIN